MPCNNMLLLQSPEHHHHFRSSTLWRKEKILPRENHQTLFCTQLKEITYKRKTSGIIPVMPIAAYNCTHTYINTGPWAAKLVDGSPAHSTELELGGLWGPFQHNPFCGSMKYVSHQCWPQYYTFLIWKKYIYMHTYKTATLEPIDTGRHFRCITCLVWKSNFVNTAYHLTIVRCVVNTIIISLRQKPQHTALRQSFLSHCSS